MTAPGRVGLYSSGLWRLRRDVEAVTGLRPARRRFTARGLDAVAGWGRRPTTVAARRIAGRAGLPFLTLEDGFFRSVRPGAAERAIGYVLDPEGIYYDAASPSALERLVLARAAAPGRAAEDAAIVVDAVRRRGLSKYNAFDADPGGAAVLGDDPTRTVLVVDQTAGDAAVSGAGADAGTFRAMLAAAAEENPNARMVIKTHPETVAGMRPGHFDDAALDAAAADSPALREARAAGRIVRLTARLRPVDLFGRVSRVYAVSSLLGLEALIAGRPVVAFGQAFYAGWGLTEDRAPPTPRRRPAPLDSLLAAAYVDYTTYLHPRTRARIPIGEALDDLERRVIGFG